MKQSLIQTENVKKNKVAIMGYGESWKRAPFDEPDWEIWGLNALYEKIPRWDRWFEIHKRSVNLDDEGPEHIWKLAGMTCPIYMQEHFPDIPTSVAYPLGKVIKQFRPYLTSSFSFMAALAIMEGFQEIGIFGVDTADEEWGSQRPSLEYFLGYAEGKGIKVTIPHESSLLRAPFIYGWQEREEQELFGKLANREAIYALKRREATQARDTAIYTEAYYAGGISALHALRNEWRLPFDIEDLKRGEEEAD